MRWRLLARRRGEHPAGAPRLQATRRQTVVRLLVGSALIGGLAWAGIWRLQGGRWYAVATPSMGTAAPVGTLLWVEPVPFHSIEVGDIVTFHPPGSRHRTFTHRVVGRNPDGSLATKGDINKGPDPWRIGPHDVVGRVWWRWWGAGWVVRAMPILAGGGLLLWMLTRWFTAPRLRSPVRIVGAAALLSLSIYVVKPLVRAEQVSFVPLRHGARATYVATGVAPIRLSARGEGHIDLTSGHVGSITSTKQHRDGRFYVHIGHHIPTWWWIVGVLMVMSPALWSVAVGWPEPAEEPPAGG